jgi:transposase
MRKIKEVLRLRNELNLDQRQIARSCSIAVSTVHEYLKRAAAAHLVWPLTDGWDDARLETALFPCPDTPPQPPTKRSPPDFAATHEQLQRHRHVTLQLVWEEYRDANPDGYGYSRFCELYQRWRQKLDVVLRQEHKGGEKAFVDWAGATLPIYDRASGEVWQASLFVAALGASSYTWAEVTRDQQMESWLLAHTHALEFWGGVPRLIVPDNTKTGVSKSCRYDPDVNPTYQNFAAHYGFGVLPARPYKPRDKAVVENAVQVAQRWIVAALRQRKFFSLAEANQAIGELLHRINHRPFRKRDGSRASVFAALDQPALLPLPQERFEIAAWERARVNIDYHVAFDGNFYSVPYTLVQEAVEIRATAVTVEILHPSGRVASHVRSRGQGKVVTIDAHRPKSHQAHLEWPPSRMVQWAEKIGPHTARLFERILADKPHPEMGYRGCLGIIRLAEQYSPIRMEAAAERALLTGACRYRSVASILKHSLDRQPLAAAAPAAPPASHDNIRGAEYFE